jgi:hypothetical protein
MRFFPNEALKALLGVVGERFPAKALKLLARLRQGADLNQELLAPVRMIVYSLLGEAQYERYQKYEHAALQGDEEAENAWITMLRTCRMLLRAPKREVDPWVLAN